MELIPTDSKDTRTRIHIRAASDEGDGLIAYEDVDVLSDDAATQIQQLLSAHPVDQYPEGAYIGSFAAGTLESKAIRDPETICADPYPYDIPLTEFPPTEHQLCGW